MTRPLRIAFVHPELGIGGAERLVVDAASALQWAGHRVVLFTSRCERRRSFAETRDGTLDVRVHGAFLPFSIAQRLRVPCAIARMAWLALARELRAGAFDAVFCDLVPHVVPLLRRASGAPVLFYCHFPDALLAPTAAGLYRAYRAPLDAMELRGMLRADHVAVNSRFTARELCRAFPRVAARSLQVVHPGIDTEAFRGASLACSWSEEEAAEIVLLSVARFSPEKNLLLAVRSLMELSKRLEPRISARLRLVLAGAYDARLAEARRLVSELRAAAQLGSVARHVEFRFSPDERMLRRLYASAACVVCTPEREHFGLVPLEAMASGRPVVAARSGGPLETIVDGETGILCEATPEQFAAALARLLRNPLEAGRMGEAGRLHVAEHFSRRAFGRRLEPALLEAISRAGAGAERRRD